MSDDSERMFNLLVYKAYMTDAELNQMLEHPGCLFGGFGILIALGFLILCWIN